MKAEQLFGSCWFWTVLLCFFKFLSSFSDGNTDMNLRTLMLSDVEF